MIIPVVSPCSSSSSSPSASIAGSDANTLKFSSIETPVGPLPPVAIVSTYSQLVLASSFLKMWMFFPPVFAMAITAPDGSIAISFGFDIEISIVVEMISDTSNPDIVENITMRLLSLSARYRKLSLCVRPLGLFSSTLTAFVAIMGSELRLGSPSIAGNFRTLFPSVRYIVFSALMARPAGFCGYKKSGSVSVPST